MPAQQPDGLELVGRLPVEAFREGRPQLGPLIEHPLAAAGRRLQVQDQALGVFGIVDEIGVGNSLVAVVLFDINVRVRGQRAAIVREEFLAEAEDFVRLAFGLFHAGVRDISGDPGGLGPPGPVAQPRVVDGVIHGSSARRRLVARGWRSRPLSGPRAPAGPRRP